MSEKALASPEFFKSLAVGIFTNSSDTDEGRAALLDAYNSYDWSDNDKVLATLEEYGHMIKQKNKDLTTFGDETEALAPVPLDMEGIKDPAEAYNRWEKANLKALEETKNPAYLSMRTQLMHDIKEYASEKRRGLYEEQTTEGVRGAVGGALSEVGNRMLRGFSTGIEPAVNAYYGDGYELNKSLTEKTSKFLDDSLPLGILEGVTNAGGAILAGATPLGAAGTVGFLGTQAVDAIGTRYSDTKYSRGNENGEATKAALIETGSQALQLASGIPIFGGLIARQVGAQGGKVLAKAAGISALAEGGTEGTGQYISSFAQDIEQNLDRPWDDSGRVQESLRAGLIGGIVGGAAEVAANRYQPRPKKTPNALDTNARSDELNKYGDFVTPQTTQVVGDVVAVRDPAIAQKQDDEIPAEFDYVDSETLEPVADTATEDVPVKDKIQFPDLTAGRTTAFKTDKNETYEQAGPNRYAETGKLPHDASLFLDADTYAEVAPAIDDGTGVATYEDGKLELTTKDGKKAIPFSYSPSPNAGLLNVSEPRSPDRNTELKQVKTGGRILEILPGEDRSMGAAGSGPSIVIKESALGQHLRTSDKISNVGKAIGEKGIGYRVMDQVEKVASIAADLRDDTNLQTYVAQIQEMANGPKISDRSAITTAMFNHIEAQIQEAQLTGDAEKEQKYTKLAEETYPAISQIGGTDFAQGLGTNRLKVDMGASKRAVKAAEDLAKANVVIGAEEGVTVDVVLKAEKLLDGVSKAIEVQNEVVAEESQKVEVPQELIDINTAIEELETPARERLDSDLSDIAAEEEGLTEEIAVIEKKAKRSKRKAEATVAEDVANASLELVKAMADADKLKGVTQEETARLEAESQKALEDAVKKASAEVVGVVKEERAARENEARTRLEIAQDKVTKAEAALEAKKTAADERLQKLLVAEKNAQAAGKPTGDIRARIDNLTASITNAATRVQTAKDNLKAVETSLSAENEANVEAEKILSALEEGIEVKVVAAKGGRKPVVQTKRSGMNITSLFKNKDSAAHGSLLALSKAVNDLAGTIKQAGRPKAANNARIAELNARIKEGQAALEASRKADALSPKEKDRIAAARKRLQELAAAKAEATLDSRIPKPKRETYKKYKDRKDAIGKEPKKESAAAKAAKDRLRQLEKDREKLANIVKKKAEAKKVTDAEKRLSVQDSLKLQEYRRILEENPNLAPTQQAIIENKIYALLGVNETDVLSRSALMGLWASNVINGTITGSISLVSGGITSAVMPVALTINDIAGFGKDIITGNVGKRKLTGAAFLAGISNPSLWLRAGLAARAAAYGARVKYGFGREDLTVDPDVRATKFKQSHSEIIGDFWEYSQKLDIKKTVGALKKLVALNMKAAGVLSFIPMRYLAASEALVGTMLRGGYDAAAAAAYYNRDARRGVQESDLIKYKYNATENWTNSKLKAKATADMLRNNGIEFTKHQEVVAAIEYYNEYLPREVQLSAFKIATQAVGNGPAQGHVGFVADLFGRYTDKVPVVQFLAPFGNSVAHFLNEKLHFTPYGFFDTQGRTEFEKSVIRSKALTGTVGSLLLVAALKQIIDDGEELPIDFISTDGGYSRAIKIGNILIETKDTPLALWAMGVGAALDAVKKGEIPKHVPITTVLWSAFVESAKAEKDGIGDSVSMLKGVTDLWRAATGTEDQVMRAVHTLIRTGKGFVPGAHSLAMAARFFDNPVVGRADMLSAIVENIPGFQSAYGKPALNMFGEPKPSGWGSWDLSLYRIFSSAPADVDMRWLVDNNYTVPSINTMAFNKELKEAAANNDTEKYLKLDYNLKHRVYSESAADLREVVSQFRQEYGNAPFSPEVQKALNKAFNDVLNDREATIAEEYGD